MWWCFFLRALLCLLPWVVFYVIYGAEHQCEHIMQRGIKIHKGNKLHCYFCFNRTTLFDHFAFWFLEKLIPNSVLHLECWCAYLCSSRSSWCRAVSHGWQWMVAVQAQRVATTQAWRSPVETSEFHAKLCGNVCCFVEDLHFVSVLRPCPCALPVGDSVSVSQSGTTAQHVGLGQAVWADQWSAGPESLSWVIYGLPEHSLGF